MKLDAPRAFLAALSTIRPSEPASLRAALARGLRVVTVALADTVGPSEWGLQLHMPDAQSDAKDMLDSLFEVLCAPLFVLSSYNRTNSHFTDRRFGYISPSPSRFFDSSMRSDSAAFGKFTPGTDVQIGSLRMAPTI